MASEGVDLAIFGAMTAVFLVITLVLGWYGYKNTRNNEEFLLGRNKTGPVIIALSYGATFLSASAVIGFGGQAAVHGMSVMWLCLLNLFVGLIVAFLIFGGPTRRKGKALGASTYADLLGKVYKSKGIRAFTAILIIVMMPIYAAAVLKGGVNSLAVITGLTEYYDYILIALAIIVAVYVVYGGIIAVMYNDAFQAAIMFIGMVVILVATYGYFGGVTPANEGLDNLWDVTLGGINPGDLGVLDGFNGWTNFSDFGSAEWLTVVTTFLLGVGIGALTQPQLAVRFMSAKSDKDLNKSLIVGSVFMLAIVGSAYTVGALSNVYFYEHYGQTAFEYITGMGLGTDFIIPQYILELFSNISFGDIFVSLFLLSLVCAAISTISALLHTIGAAGGYDLYTLWKNKKGHIMGDSQSVNLNRAFIVVIMVLTVLYCYMMPNDIIAKATSVFMGMTAAALLPAYFHAMYSKDPCKKAAIASMVAGTVVYLFFALFMNTSTCVFLPICELLTGQSVLFPDSILASTDALVIALPVSIVVLAVTLAYFRLRERKANGEVEVGSI